MPPLITSAGEGAVPTLCDLKGAIRKMGIDFSRACCDGGVTVLN